MDRRLLDGENMKTSSLPVEGGFPVCVTEDEVSRREGVGGGVATDSSRLEPSIFCCGFQGSSHCVRLFKKGEKISIWEECTGAALKLD